MPPLRGYETGSRVPSCPLCGGVSQLWIRQNQRDLLRCTRCRFAWVLQGVSLAPAGRSIYEDDASFFFQDGSAEYYLGPEAEEAAEGKLRWVEQFVAPGGTLLDIGANVGQFVKVAGRQYEATGIELNPGAAGWARESLGAPVELGSVYDDRPDFAGQFDAITMFDVLEHLPHPRRALEECRRWLTTEGRLFITTPNMDSLIARLLGRAWHYIDIKEHIALFGAGNLGTLLKASGFEVEARRTFGRRYRFSYVERRLRYLAEGSALLRAAHAMAIPLRLFPERSVTVNMGDVMGIVARRT